VTRLAAIVLAAGHARRFGADKLMQPFRSAPLLAHAISAARSDWVERIVIVARPSHAVDALCRAVRAEDSRIVCVRIASGALSDSLRAGLAAIADAEGVFVFLGDMPLVPEGLVDRMAARLEGAFAVQPVFAGRPGHPVLLSARAAALARNVSGDRGAGEILRQHAGEVAYIETDDERVALDIDTRADYEALMRRGED
jgi:molybdenum cofactor cytidylyltransferase